MDETVSVTLTMNEITAVLACVEQAKINVEIYQRIYGTVPVNLIDGLESAHANLGAALAIAVG